MSILRWFSRKQTASSKSAPSARNAKAPPSAQGRDSRPLLPPSPSDLQGQSQRQRERAERRELLFIVVRDAMVGAGVLSTSYKFKVLSLDPRGKQFLVMVDLAREYAQDSSRLNEIESQIAHAAKARYSIGVTAVYWRINDQIQATSASQMAPLTARAPLRPTGAAAPAPSEPAPTPTVMRSPVQATVSAPMPLTPEPPAAPVFGATPVPPGKHFEPIEADEVAAFKRALASSAHPAVTSKATAPSANTTARPSASPPHVPGFADTEMPLETRNQDLSTTQYGDLV